MTDSRYAALPHLDTADPLEPRPSSSGFRQSQSHSRTSDHRQSTEYPPVGLGDAVQDVQEGQSDTDSDVSFRDTLDVEPFDEKQGVDERFRDEPSMEDGEEGYAMEPRRLRPRKKSRRVLAALLGIVLTAAVIGILAGWGYSAPSYSVKAGNRHITLDHVFNGTFAPKSSSIDWVKEAADGTFSTVDSDHNILLSSVHNTSASRILVDSSLVLLPSGAQLHWNSWALSADMEYILFEADHLKQWRHSSHANYYIHRLSDHVTFPVSPPQSPPVIAKCIWAPAGHGLAYVMDNDLYVIPSSEMDGSDPIGVRVTDDGSEVVFNGVPDWVYEEEVYSSDYTLWWSLDGATIAYLRMDEAAVKEYKLQYYNPSNDAFESNQYPTELDMKYPKPGTPNPLVSVHTFSLSSYLDTHLVDPSKQRLSWPDQLLEGDQIISEVAWVGANSLLVKEVDRASKVGNVVLFQDGTNRGEVVRKLGKEGEQGDDGWIDQALRVEAVPGWSTEGYLDIVPNKGYNHVAFFSPLDASEPIWITEGQWEVTDIAGINASTGQVYFIGANPSIDRHLYSAPLPTSINLDEYTQDITPLTDTSKAGWYDVSISPGSNYYLLSYQGPEIPYQRLLGVEDDRINVVIEDNKALNATLSEFMRPIITQTTISNGGFELNMMEIRPPGLDPSGRKRYPVLLAPYGGPGSQQVSNKFKRDWASYLACEKKYIVVVVDPRGTGFKGREFRNPVRDNLGYWEVLDFIKAAGELSKRSYVDSRRIGIWGWSYGGYITLKTLEAASGAFTLGVAVAPVTDWLLYDSIYTERYMSTPSANPHGYISSSVNNVTAFANVDLAWAHGSGDDNVHYGHTAGLLDKLTQKHVRGWRFRMFTDSDHSMSKREAYRELHEWMTSFIEEKWGRGGTVRHG